MKTGRKNMNIALSKQQTTEAISQVLTGPSCVHFNLFLPFVFVRDLRPLRGRVIDFKLTELKS